MQQRGSGIGAGLTSIIGLSRYYGRDPNWVIAGGGNSSWKDKTSLWVKASGTSLAAASAETFVEIDRAQLASLWDKDYPTDPELRERQALDDLMATRYAGQSLRPSVETGMHDVLPQAFVFHSHPTLVNAVTCSVEGEERARQLFVDELFGPEIVWIPSINPGYVLSKRILDEVASYRDTYKTNPRMILLQNHGLTVAAESPEEIHRMHSRCTELLLREVRTIPDVGAVDADLHVAAGVIRAIGDARVAEGATDKETVVLFEANAEALSRGRSRASMEPLSTPFSPDHIVYAGHTPLYVEEPSDVEERYTSFVRSEGTHPKIVVVRNLGFFAVGANRKSAEAARMLFRDALQIARYAENFGGSRGMERGEIDFIRNWEVERFRAQVSLQE